MTLPAATAVVSGRYAERPCAIVSALTNSSTASASFSRYGALVLLPAPFGPASTIMFSATTSCGTSAYRHGLPPYVAACADALTHHSSAA